jgi:hypothetical protein
MKTLLKVSLLVTALAGSSLWAATTVNTDSANAAPAKGRHHAVRALARHAAVRRHLAHRLGLSTDQVAQLKTARASAAASVKAIRADSSLTLDQKKAKVHETIKAAHTQMRSVLTAEQQKKLHHLRAHLRKARGRG